MIRGMILQVGTSRKSVSEMAMLYRCGFHTAQDAPVPRTEWGNGMIPRPYALVNSRFAMENHQFQ